MITRWFRLEDFYRTVGDRQVFYPPLYARGYALSPEQRARLDGVLGPFLEGRLRVEFVAVFLITTFLLTVAAGAYLVTASTEELDAILATPPWVVLVGAVVLAGAIVAPVVFRLRSTIRRQLDAMGVQASEPPRPDFFIVDGAFSVRRLFFAILALAVLLVLIVRVAG